MTTSTRSEHRDATYFDAIAAGATVTLAAKTAGYARRTVYHWREVDEVFQTRWTEAVDTAVERLEAEADRRGAEGVLRPVFYQGEQCGVIREFSDVLLIFRLKALRPEMYRDHAHVKIDQRITGQTGVLRVPTVESPEVWEARATALYAAKSEDHTTPGEVL